MTVGFHTLFNASLIQRRRRWYFKTTFINAKTLNLQSYICLSCTMKSVNEANLSLFLTGNLTNELISYQGGCSIGVSRGELLNWKICQYPSHQTPSYLRRINFTWVSRSEMAFWLPRYLPQVSPWQSRQYQSSAAKSRRPDRLFYGVGIWGYQPTLSWQSGEINS